MSTLNSQVKESGGGEQKAEALAGPRFQNEKTLLAIIKATPFFYQLTAEEFAEVSSQIRVHHLHGETVVVREGEPGESLYFVVDGMLRVTIRKPGEEKNILLSKLGKGDFFGEYSVLTGRFRSATVTTITSAELLEIPRQIYEKAAFKYSSIIRFLVDLLQQHERHSAEVMASLGIDRRVQTRLKRKGSIKFQEYSRSEEKKVVGIGAGLLQDLTAGGLCFRAKDGTVAGRVAEMYGKRYKIRLEPEGVATPIKLLGEVVSFETGIYHGELAEFYIIRMKTVYVDKKDLEALEGILKSHKTS